MVRIWFRGTKEGGVSVEPNGTDVSLFRTEVVISRGDYACLKRRARAEGTPIDRYISILLYSAIQKDLEEE